MSGLRRLSLPDDVGEGLVGRLRGGLRGARRAPVGGVDPWTGGERGERVRVHLGCRDLTNKHVTTTNNKTTTLTLSDFFSSLLGYLPPVFRLELLPSPCESPPVCWSLPWVSEEEWCLELEGEV